MKKEEEKLTPQQKQDERIKNIMLTILNTNVLEFLCLPNRKGEFIKFKQFLSPDDKLFFEEMNVDISSDLWGYNFEAKEKIMTAIPKIYYELKRTAKHIIPTYYKQAINHETLDLAMKFLLEQIRDEIENDRDISAITPPVLLKTIEDFKQCLTVCTAFAGTVEKYLNQLILFVSYYMGEPDSDAPEISELNILDEEKQEDKTIHSLSFSQSSSSSSSSSSSQSITSDHNPRKSVTRISTSGYSSLISRPDTPIPSSSSKGFGFAD